MQKGAASQYFPHILHFQCSLLSVFFVIEAKEQASAEGQIALRRPLLKFQQRALFPK